ncbi:MAG TPA: SIMPL domain-containing protein [Candidatus Limnocylindrales bacterium]|nr:SIMPL domain-containing protein [Candidatus Limnocylindrales bacterium]
MTTSSADRTGPETRHITVPGTGRVTVEPDIATVRLGVVVVRPSAAAARETAAATMSAILAAVGNAGVERRDLRTALVSLNPVTDYSSERGPRVTGYQVANTVEVTVRDLSAAGDVIDAGLGAGATSLDGLEFRLDDGTTAEASARRAAVEDARRRAETLAEAGGVRLGDVVAIVEGQGPPEPVPFGGGLRGFALKAEAAADTPVESGRQEAVVSVVVTFALA